MPAPPVPFALTINVVPSRRSRTKIVLKPLPMAETRSLALLTKTTYRASPLIIGEKELPFAPAVPAVLRLIN